MIKLNDGQEKAKAKIEDWLRSDSPMFFLSGTAGTGKTTLIQNVITNNPHINWAGAATTGKAASVLCRKGIFAQTIHKLFFRPMESDEEDLIQEILVRIEELYSNLNSDLTEIKQLEKRLEEIITPYFVSNGEDFNNMVVIIDESSMLGKFLAKRVLKRNGRVIFIGDKNQLPPIRDAAFFQKNKPNAELTKNERNADSIRNITDSIRGGNTLLMPNRNYGPGVYVLNMHDIPDIPSYLAQTNQIICGYNQTRRYLNRLMLMHHGIVDRYPSGAPNEKLICLKNNYKINIYNGLDMTITKRTEENHIDRWFKAYFGHPLPHKVYMGHFDDTVKHEKYRLYQEAKIRKKLVEMDWAYAVTVHKAQGSEWEKVIVIDDGIFSITSKENRRRWLYTACTRAIKELTIIEWETPREKGKRCKWISLKDANRKAA